MQDDSDDDVEIITQAKKKFKKDKEDEDYSHFVAVYDIDNGTEHLEEKQGKPENPVLKNNNALAPGDSDESCILLTKNC
jgi:hypothetical protein